MSTSEKQEVIPLPAVEPREGGGDKVKETDGIKQESSPQRTIRKSVLFTSFHLLPTALAIFCLISLLLVMFSGTKLTGSADTNHGSSGGAILLSDIAVVTFDGLVEQPSGYAVTFHWFMNGFGWTYPTQDPDSDSVGLVYANRGPVQETQLSLPGDLFYAAQLLHGPGCDEFAAYNASHACYPTFLNQFFPDATKKERRASTKGDDVLRYRPDREFPSGLSLSLHYIAVWLTALALAVDLWFLLSRSRRLFFFPPRRDAAASPPGGNNNTDSSSEVVDPRRAARNARRSRVALYAAAAVAVLAALGSLLGVGAGIANYLASLPGAGRMRPRVGAGFLWLGGVCAASAVAAAALTGAQMWMGERAEKEARVLAEAAV